MSEQYQESIIREQQRDHTGNELKWLGNVSSELLGIRCLDFDHFDSSEGDMWVNGGVRKVSK